MKGGKKRNSHLATIQETGSVLQTCLRVSIQAGIKKKWGEHKMVSPHICLDKSKGCRGVIETTWLVMRGTSHDGGGLTWINQHSS